MDRGRPRPSLIGGPLLAAAALLGAAAPASAASGLEDCYATCAGESPCRLSATMPRLPQPVLPARALDDRSLRLVSQCGARTVEDGRVVLRYRHGGRWFVPPAPLQKGDALVKVFDAYPADACSVPRPECTQAEMQGLKASAGGHGIDGQPSIPAGHGNPCALGLPCGVVMPPPAAWQFRLEDAALAGSWRVRVLRGQAPAGAAPQIDSPVAGGTVAADGGWFAPGVTYAYALLARDGSLRASGEFTVQSAAQHAALQRLAVRRVEAGLSERAALVDALAANRMDWNAYQLNLD